MQNRIAHINHYTMSGFVFLNLITIGYFFYFEMEEWMIFLLFLTNLIILWYYIHLNTEYWKEHEKLFAYFREFIQNKWTPTQFPKQEDFSENAELLSLFKRTYIEQNLLKKDYKELKSVFEKFIPKKIHDELWFRWYERIILGSAVTKSLTIMFLDIMSFAAVQEQMKNTYRTLVLLNIYFDGIGEIVEKYGWYIDKYLSDGIIVLFESTSTDGALRAAIEIQEFIKKFQVGTHGQHLRAGIGLHRWEVVMGTIGTKKRMDATIIWETVDIVRSLEKLTHTYEPGIILSEAVHHNILDASLFDIHFLVQTSLTWVEKPLTLYGVDNYSPKLVSLEIEKIA